MRETFLVIVIYYVFTTCFLQAADPDTVIRIDFGDDNQAPKIGFVGGGNWNTITASTNDLDGDAGTDTAFYELKDINTNATGIIVTNWMGTWATPSDNNIDSVAYDGTDFLTSGDSAFDVFRITPDGGTGTVTFAGFSFMDTVNVRLAAAMRIGGPDQIGDYTFDGSFGDGSLGDDFNCYSNSQAAAGTGQELTWTLSGKNEYEFSLVGAAGQQPAFNAMIITITPAPSATTIMIR